MWNRLDGRGINLQDGADQTFEVQVTYRLCRTAAQPLMPRAVRAVAETNVSVGRVLRAARRITIARRRSRILRVELPWPGMQTIRQVVVFDAADVAAESAFWSGLLEGRVVDDDPAFHCVLDSLNQWRVGVQLAPEHVPPDWLHGAPQQIHMDLHVTDPGSAHDEAMRLGARLLREDDLTSEEGHQVYADPAGHPFCIGWGHPSNEALAAFVAKRFGDPVR